MGNKHADSQKQPFNDVCKTDFFQPERRERGLFHFSYIENKNGTEDKISQNTDQEITYACYGI